VGTLSGAPNTVTPCVFTLNFSELLPTVGILITKGSELFDPVNIKLDETDNPTSDRMDISVDADNIKFVAEPVINAV
jgi:hypothetical protein